MLKMVLKGKKESFVQAAQKTGEDNKESRREQSSGERIIIILRLWEIVFQRRGWKRERQMWSSKNCDMLGIHAGISTEKLLLGGVFSARGDRKQ